MVTQMTDFMDQRAEAIDPKHRDRVGGQLPQRAQRRHQIDRRKAVGQRHAEQEVEPVDRRLDAEEIDARVAHHRPRGADPASLLRNHHGNILVPSRVRCCWRPSGRHPTALALELNRQIAESVTALWGYLPVLRLLARGSGGLVQRFRRRVGALSRTAQPSLSKKPTPLADRYYAGKPPQTAHPTAQAVPSCFIPWFLKESAL